MPVKRSMCREAKAKTPREQSSAGIGCIGSPTGSQLCPARGDVVTVSTIVRQRRET